MNRDVRPRKNKTDRSRKDETSPESDLKELTQRVSAFCREAGYQLSPSADAILKDMVNMKQLTGDFYCPCQTQRGPDTICVCQPVRHGLVDLMGACFCNLIVSNNKVKE